MYMGVRPPCPNSRTLLTKRGYPGELGAFLLALVIVAALGVGFLLNSLAGVGIVMVAIVPVIYLVLITISVGR